MRQPLDKALRKKLEDTVIKGRDIVEVAVEEALQRLGISDSQVPSYLNESERKLRNKLRSHARQLGDVLQDGKQQIERLSSEMAYEHWHRMLFACFLEQNNLLMYDQYTAVTIEECAELAEEEADCKDGWELAGRLAQKMLPQIFRVDSPVFEVKLSINHVNELESLISRLDPQTYQAQDSLGWCYQFWQTKKKDQVNKSGVKIGAQELSSVTQLFTEPYMVSFLLDNALGAWWANKRLTQDDLIRANNEQELRELASIPGVPLEYLRFIKDEESEGLQGKWKPAAGGFEKWPEDLSELKTLDPCCGSGHFLVAKFLMLVPMRMQLEGLTETEAVDAVIRDNIHGLELDQRCVELAAFALALEAWRYPNAGGYRVLPELQLACSGMSINEAQKEWKELAKDDQELQGAIKWMQETFKDAPTLGSLIDPNKYLNKGERAPWMLLQHASQKASTETKTIAQGLVKAAAIQVGKYQWVVTNVPYLTGKKQSSKLKSYCEKNYPRSKGDLSTVFLEKSISWLNNYALSSIVLPHNWLFLSSYSEFRKYLLGKYKFNFLCNLGENSFTTPLGVSPILFGIQKDTPSSFLGIDASNCSSFEDKSTKLRSERLKLLLPEEQLSKPDYRITFSKHKAGTLLNSLSTSSHGQGSFDAPRFSFMFQELNETKRKWEFQQSSPTSTKPFSGCSFVFRWDKGQGELFDFMNEKKKFGYSSGKWKAGVPLWNKKGVIVRQIGELPASFYLGYAFDDDTAVFVPSDETLIPAIWAFISSSEFNKEVRKIDQKRNVTNSTLGKVNFESDKWTLIANRDYPNGLPKPHSDDPTQWIFHGHPCESVIWNEETKTTAIGELRQDDTVLQVAVARLLGYQWPAELDADMELAPEMREVMKKNADFAGLIDDDGIVCIPAVRGEKTAIKRLEAILYKVYGDEWTSSVEANLLKSVKAKDLESWLRDKFFDQHSKLFQHRPFIWQIWDGLSDGFSALFNYHMLDYKGLERLIYTYLDDWISSQKRELADGKDGADIRLTAAENLKGQLEAILEGERGLDIFVRWKPLAEQPIGWSPDLNDGVRLNIRPFMNAKDIGKKGAGVLRGKPNIHWKKDRGTDVASAPWFNLGLEYGGKQGDRINDHHLTLAEKKAAREA